MEWVSALAVSTAMPMHQDQDHPRTDGHTMGPLSPGIARGTRVDTPLTREICFLKQSSRTADNTGRRMLRKPVPTHPESTKGARGGTG